MALYNILRKSDVVLNGQGQPVRGGRVELYEPGGTSSQITAYKDSGLQTPHTQPIPLTGSGRANIWVTRDCDMYVYDRNNNLVAQELNANPTLLGADQLGGLINNGSFELDEDGNDEPDFWDRTDEAGSSNGIDTSESTDGAQSFRFTSSGTGGGTLTTSDFFPVNDTDQLRVNFDLLASVATVRNIVRVQWYDVSQVAISNTDVYDSTANPTSWTSSNTAAVPPTNARFAKLAIIGCEASGAAGSTWVDRVQVFYPSVVVGEFDNILIQDNTISTLNTNGSLAITPNGNGSVDIGNSNDPDLADTANAVNIGTDDPANDPHLALGPSVIQAKADGTTAAALNLNPEGGAVTVGGTALGAAATATVVTNATDTTAERVVTTGWMYLGSTGTPAESDTTGDLNTIPMNRFYAFQPGVANIPPDAASDRGAGLRITRIGSPSRFDLVVDTEGYIHSRSEVGGVWNAWVNYRKTNGQMDLSAEKRILKIGDYGLGAQGFQKALNGDEPSGFYRPNTFTFPESNTTTSGAAIFNAKTESSRGFQIIGRCNQSAGSYPEIVFREQVDATTYGNEVTAWHTGNLPNPDTTYAHRSNNLSDLDSASSARTNLGLGSAATEADTKYAHRSNNLSDLDNAITARANLNLGTAATQADTKYAHRTNNLSDLSSPGSARSNLELGSAATEADTKYAHRSNNLSDLDSASSARTNLGLGSAAIASHQTDRVELGGDFDAGSFVRCVKIANVVTITADTNGSLSHTAGTAAFSASGVIPAAYRPNLAGAVAANIYTIQSDMIGQVSVEADGDLVTTYRDYTGAGASESNTRGRFSITYVQDAS